MVSNISANQAAFAVVGGLALVTIGSAFAAASVASTVAVVAFSVFAFIGAGSSFGAIQAWFRGHDGDSASQYFERCKKDVPVGMVAMLQFTAQVLVQAVIQGLAGGISRNINNRFNGGVDVKFGH